MKDKGQKTEDRRQYSASILNQRGSALIITVLIVTILVALVVEFAYEVYIDTSSLSNWTNAQKASFIAKSGQTLSTNYIREINKSYNTQSKVEFPVERDFGANTQLIIRIEDENAKFNINSILIENLKGDPLYLTALQKLFEYLNINPKLADVIADWIDPDSEPRQGLYDSENNAKNSKLQSIDELKLITGIDKKTFEIISPYLTIHGDGKINMNTAKLPVLISFKDMTETLANRIIDYRESTPFESTAEIGNNITGMRSIIINIGDKIVIESTDFRIITRATVNEIIRIIESVVDKSMKVQFWREE